MQALSSARAELLESQRANKKSKVLKEARQKKPRKPKAKSPLQKFREQTAQKRKDLKQARKKIDADLRAVEKDLGVLKRARANPNRPSSGP